MAVRVLVVDDSGFFRRRVTEMLSADPAIEVIGTAVNGQEAIEKVAELKPDVVTMDIEMPVLDGISAVRRIMSTRPTPILMFSSLTSDGAQATLDALDAGALDFLPKRFEDIAQDRDTAKQLLCSRVRSLGQRGIRVIAPASPVHTVVNGSVAKPAAMQSMAAGFKKGGYKLVAIGTSTGGPAALQQVLSKLPAQFPVPILLIQHMPASFTPAFAQRLNQLCAITVKEAAEGDLLTPGTALLAPGGRQMTVEARGGGFVVHIHDSDALQNYKPCVDVTFGSLARAMPGQVLAVVLTGMGADGREGARLLKQGGATIWAQDEQSCVIYGMPMAIVEAGLADQVLSLPSIGNSLIQKV
ncbi:MAG TPA: chemotaxis response regulator protein-glutamate methylesterase [Gammaproteobacteria bacterium]|nr:chemotaxis response regulator protein-glutamate methylesterase [Gammaproteobacteria bacterium]